MVAARSMAWVCGRSFTGTAGSNPAWGHGHLSFVNVVYCHAEVHGTRLSLVKRSPTECGVYDSDLENSTIWMPRPT